MAAPLDHGHNKGWTTDWKMAAHSFLCKPAQWRMATYRSDLLPRYVAKTRDLFRDVPDAEIFFFF